MRGGAQAGIALASALGLIHSAGMRDGVFITDGHWRKALAAVRALGRRHIPVTVGESTWLATASFSRHCARRVVYPSAALAPDCFLEFLERDLRARPQRMLLPMEDTTIGLAARHRERLSRLTYLPVVAAPTLECAQRKDQVLALARELGIPTPRTFMIDRLAQLETLKHDLPYPVVIKPRTGAGAVGVGYADNPGQLDRLYHRIHRRFAWPLIQERIPAQGAGIGASFLIDEAGRVRASFVHRRLREYPLSGGASTLRESIRHDEIRDMAAHLLKALEWFGVAMVEFKIDPRDGRPKLMEINPRFWGSLALAIHAGVDFPHLLYRLARGERFAPVDRYRLGVQCRWLLPGDLLHFIHKPKRHRLMPDFFCWRRPDLYYDIISLRDPWPTLARLLTPLTFLYDADMRRRLEARRI
jgi:predicted ATP-grasp superfamily ATP-dependent carboligase